MRKIKVTVPSTSTLTYLAGSAFISVGAALILLPAGLIVGGALLIALVAVP